MPKQKSAAGSRNLSLTPRDLRIMRAVVQHGRLTREQVRKLFFQKGRGLASVQAVCRRLRILNERGYLIRTRLPTPMGSGPYVYQPGNLAVAAMSRDGSGLKRPGDRRRRTQSAVELLHGLEIVDFYIQLKRSLVERDGEILVWLSERQCRYRIPRHGRSLPFTPDAYCLWGLGSEEGAFFLEWDRGTESMVRIAEKLTRYEVYYRARAYHDHLGEIGLQPRLLFVVPDERRQRKFVQWRSRNPARGKWTSLPTILVATREHAHSQPLEEIWHKPGDARPRRLVD